MRCSVVVVDAQRLVRESLRAMLESRANLEVVGEAEDGRAAVDLCVAERPDVVVIDAQLPRLSGIEAVRRIRSRDSRSRCVITSESRGSSHVRAALLAGASGFVPKSAPAVELLEAIEAARRAEPFFVRCVEDYLGGAPGEMNGADGDPAKLSGRQIEVLQLVAEGMSTKEIAGELGVSIKTAQTHRANLMKKVRAHKASELVRYAIREGIVKV